MFIISQRLLTIANLVKKGQLAADIGADHAQLSIYLIQQSLVPRVIIGELGSGPYNRALKAVKKSRLDCIEVRQGSGLRVLDHGEVDTVVMAGLGGETIAEILADDWEKAASFKYYVLQPMGKVQVLRQLLAGRGWLITNEKLLKENGHFYVIIAVRPDAVPYNLSALELEIGPQILRASGNMEREFLQYHLKKYMRITASLHNSSPYNQVVPPDLQEKLNELERIIDACQG